MKTLWIVNPPFLQVVGISCCQEGKEKDPAAIRTQKAITNAFSMIQLMIQHCTFESCSEQTVSILTPAPPKKIPDVFVILILVIIPILILVIIPHVYGNQNIILYPSNIYNYICQLHVLNEVRKISQPEMSVWLPG